MLCERFTSYADGVYDEIKFLIAATNFEKNKQRWGKSQHSVWWDEHDGEKGSKNGN